MNLFISWSKERSRRVATLLRDWIPLILPDVSPFLSSEDIDKGDIWFADISTALKTASFCIICVTEENIHSEWVHFEAGAIANSLAKGRICPLLIDIQSADLIGPLASFQAATMSKEELFKLLCALNQVQDKPTSEIRIKSLLDVLWDQFEDRVRQVIAATSENETFWGNFLSKVDVSTKVPVVVTAKSGVDWENGKPTTKRGHTPQLTYNEVVAFLQLKDTMLQHRRQARLVHGGIAYSETGAINIPEFMEDETLIVIGSPHANQFCRQVLSGHKMGGVPFTFESNATGKCIAVRTRGKFPMFGGSTTEYYPASSLTSATGQEDVLDEDYGIILKVSNPLDASRRHKMLILGGNHGFGTESAVNFVASDQRLDLLHSLSGGNDFEVLFEATVGRKRGLRIGIRRLSVARDNSWHEVDVSQL